MGGSVLPKSGHRASWESVGTAGAAGNPGGRKALEGHRAVKVQFREPESSLS